MALFNGAGGANAAGPAGHLGLWTTDGTAGGTSELIPPAGAGAAATGLDPTDMTVFNSKVLFNGVDAQWSFRIMGDGRHGRGDARVVAEATGASSGLDPTDMTVFGNEVLFSGVDANWSFRTLGDRWHGQRHPRAPRGGPGGDSRKDPHGLSPTDFTVFNGEVFFNGLDQFGRGQLWETDGTAAGTQMLTVPGADNVGHKSVQL